MMTSFLCDMVPSSFRAEKSRAAFGSCSQNRKSGFIPLQRLCGSVALGFLHCFECSLVSFDNTVHDVSLGSTDTGQVCHGLIHLKICQVIEPVQVTSCCIRSARRFNKINNVHDDDVCKCLNELNELSLRLNCKLPLITILYLF